MEYIFVESKKLITAQLINSNISYIKFIYQPIKALIALRWAYKFLITTKSWIQKMSINMGQDKIWTLMSETESEKLNK